MLSKIYKLKPNKMETKPNKEQQELIDEVKKNNEENKKLLAEVDKNKDKK